MSIENNSQKEKYCFVCGNQGFFDKVCPGCGREPKQISMNLDKRKDSEEYVKKVTVAGIPSLYAGIMWDPQILRDSKPEKSSDFSFDRFVQQLEKINSVFARGMIPQKSAIIIAPAGYSKMVFAYSCLQRALDNGFTIAPILDTVEIKRFLTLSGDNPNYSIGDLTYDKYIMSDVLFATVTKLQAHEWAFQAIEELLDRRARKGLGTFIISRFSLTEISKRDYSDQFSVIASARASDDMKYPAVIRYKEMLNENITSF